MKVEGDNIRRVRDLFRELDQLEDTLYILSNYDAGVNVEFSTLYNHNEKESKTTTLPLPTDMLKQFEQKISDRICRLKKELETK